MTKLQRVLPGSVALRLAAGERFLQFPGGDKVRRALELAQWTALDFSTATRVLLSLQQSALLADPILAQLDLEHESLAPARQARRARRR